MMKLAMMRMWMRNGGRSLKIEDFYNLLIKMNRTYFEWFTIFEELKLIFPTPDLKSVIDKCFN